MCNDYYLRSIIQHFYVLMKTILNWERKFFWFFQDFQVRSHRGPGRPETSIYHFWLLFWNWIITIIIIFSSNIFLISVSFLQLIDYLLSRNIKSWSNLDWFSVSNPSKIKKLSFSMPSLIDIIILSIFLFHVLSVPWTRIKHS